MTPEQLTMMEEKLHVTLPSAYKQVLSAFPWPEFAGGTEFSLWDDAALNVERTLEYREGYGGAPPWPSDYVHLGLRTTSTLAFGLRPPWPSDYVHIGDDDDACPYALRCSDGTIVKTDHGNLTARPLASFASVETFVQELQETLNNDG